MLAFSDNPPVRSPGVNRVADCRGRWWVAHTKARFEKAFAADLLARSVAYFLPMAERLTFSGGRRRRGMVPLFPSYVFFCDPGDDARHGAMATGRLCQVLNVADQRRLVGELSALELALAAKVPLAPYATAAAAVGSRCRVTCGPFRGLEGTVVRGDGRTRIVLEVGMLGRGVVMEIEAGLLEPVGDPGERGVPATLGAAS